MTRTTTFVTGCLAVAGLTLTACGSGGGGGGGGDDSGLGNRTFAEASDAPAATAVARNGTVVAARTWVAVAGGQDAGKPITYAIRTTGVRVGKAGDLGDVSLDTGGVDLAKAVPYYVAYDATVLAGNFRAAPNQALTAVTASGDSAPGLATLLVDQDVERCDPPSQRPALVSGLRRVVHLCAAVAATPPAKPAFLQYDKSGGTQGVRLTVPSG